MLRQILNRSLSQSQRNSHIAFNAHRGVSTALPSIKTTRHQHFVKEYCPSASSFETLEAKVANYPDTLYSDVAKKANVTADKDQPTLMTPRMEVYIRELQKTICSHLEAIEASNEMPSCAPTHGKPGRKFIYDEHIRDPKSGMAGGSKAAVLQEGAVFEKAGVNISVINGNMPASRLANMRADHADLATKLAKLGIDASSSETFPFAVAGLSLVLHPHNPHVPTVHANYRMFEMSIGNERVSWFGGGSDLTPTYVVPEDAQFFHEVINSVCESNEKDGESNTIYPRFKKWCDEYFFIPHRGETRGIGGLFFDDLDPINMNMTPDQLFKFVLDCGDHFCASYFPLVRANVHKSYTEEEKRFQQLRRGRYVEFNIMYDRGTKFGLEMPSSANVRTEAILMSLPLTARYEYRHEPAVGTPEHDTLTILKNPREWI